MSHWAQLLITIETKCGNRVLVRCYVNRSLILVLWKTMKLFISNMDLKTRYFKRLSDICTKTFILSRYFQSLITEKMKEYTQDRSPVHFRARSLSQQVKKSRLSKALVCFG